MHSSYGYVHSIETFGAVDGPGIRYVVFLSGCSLACLYCHNPDSWVVKKGKKMSLDEILEDISKYAHFIKGSSGGVTISGGDPLSQVDFTKQILLGCKEMGIHTALDTCGYLGDRVDDEMLELIDLVLLDVKSGIPSVYKKLTKVELEPTLEFAKRLDKKDISIWLRFVLVPGLTDDKENIEAVAKIASSLNNLDLVELLPFHKMGEYKWESLNKTYKLKDTLEPTQKQMDIARGIFTEKGLKVI